MCHVCGVKPSYGVTKDGRLAIVLVESNCVRCTPEGLPTATCGTGIQYLVTLPRCPEICIGYSMYSVQFKFILSVRRLHLLQAGSDQHERTWNLSTQGTSFGLGVVLVEAGR